MSYSAKTHVDPAKEAPRPRPSAKAPQPSASNAAQRIRIEEVVQRRAAKAEAERAPSSGGVSGLPARLRAGVEALSGLAMGDVRVHRNSAEPAKLDALAFTKGSDIHLGPGQEQHLPHEAWHVVQQKQGKVAGTRQLKGTRINDDNRLEAEADRMSHLIEAVPQAAPVGAISVDSARAKAAGAASGPVLQLQGRGGLAKPFAKGPSNPQDNTAVSGINERIKLKVEQLEARMAADKGKSPEQKMLEKYARLHPEVQLAMDAYKNKPQPTIRQGRKFTPWEQRYSDLWRMEFEFRNKHCSVWERERFERTGTFANEYAGAQIYLMESSGYNIAFSQDSPISVWKFLELISMRYGGTSPYGTFKDGMTSHKPAVPSSFNTTLFHSPTPAKLP